MAKPKLKTQVNVRLDDLRRERVRKIAEQERRTVTNVIEGAIDWYLKHRFGQTLEGDLKLRIRYANLPDCCVLKAYQLLKKKEFDEAMRAIGREEKFEPVSDWGRMLDEVKSGGFMVVEAFNWIPIFRHFKNVKLGAGSLTFDWERGFRLVYAAHCIFMSKAHLGKFLGDDLDAYLEFRNGARTGRELSLHSLLAWVEHSPVERKEDRAHAIAQAWKAANIASQRNTDLELGIRKVADLLKNCFKKPEDGTNASDERIKMIGHPRIVPTRDLEQDFNSFLLGDRVVFTGSLLHSSRLLADYPDDILLLAGPADLRVMSLNTLAAQKGLFDLEQAGPNESDNTGRHILNLWSKAVKWFRENIVNAASDDLLKAMLRELFGDFLTKETDVRKPADSSKRISVLHGMMKTWVRWFADHDEADTFLGEEGSIAKLVGQYEGEVTKLMDGDKSQGPEPEWPFDAFAGAAAAGAPSLERSTGTKRS